jgi:hypothetical protein
MDVGVIQRQDEAVIGLGDCEENYDWGENGGGEYEPF